MGFFNVLGDLVNALVPIGICVVLPVLIIWMDYRRRQHETDKRTAVIMAAIEKNGEIDVQDYFDKLTPKQVPFKESFTKRLHLEMLFGTILTVFGLLSVVGSAVALYFLRVKNEDMLVVFIIFGVISFAIGVGLLAAYFSGTKRLNDFSEE